MTIDDNDTTLPDSLLESVALAIKPAELAVEQRDRMRKHVLQQARDAAPQGTITQRAARSDWIEIAPLVAIRELWRDQAAGTHVSLMRMQPGGVIPTHRHAKDEDFIVLEGECYIGEYLLRAGDSHKASAGSIHADVTTRTGVTVLIRGEYPYPAAHVE
ncbi:MAG TPA: cupin domain-containing protein [Steroidobacteraceae bacterium]|nr:cupin domain-containing protein [Steroidobacteraceae bacterium]